MPPALEARRKTCQVKTHWFQGVVTSTTAALEQSDWWGIIHHIDREYQLWVLDPQLAATRTPATDGWAALAMQLYPDLIAEAEPQEVAID